MPLLSLLVHPLLLIFWVHHLQSYLVFLLPPCSHAELLVLTRVSKISLFTTSSWNHAELSSILYCFCLPCHKASFSFFIIIRFSFFLHLIYRCFLHHSSTYRHAQIRYFCAWECLSSCLGIFLKAQCKDKLYIPFALLMQQITWA